jgi:metal-responsive CopG/Arc/MetJ family transcriptional regulator
MTFRAPDYFKKEIDEWRSNERHKPSRSEAIRWLVWKGLEAEEKEASRKVDKARIVQVDVVAENLPNCK